MCSLSAQSIFLPFMVERCSMLGNAWSKEKNLFHIYLEMSDAFSQDTSNYFFVFSLAAVP